MPATKKITSGYDVHPGVAMVQTIMAGMKQKTGRSVEEWIHLVQKEGPADEEERRAWLKDKHGLGTNYAWWIAEKSVGKGADSSPETYLKQADKYVVDMFSGAKAGLRPVYDALLKLAGAWAPTSRYVPARPSCRSTGSTFSHRSSPPRAPASTWVWR